METSSAETGSSARTSSGSEGQGPGDADALALAAGELVRVAVGERGGKAAALHQGQGLRLDRGSVHRR